MKRKYDKLKLAEKQLEMACVSYSEFNQFKDYASAATLAGAAGEIFHQYLKLNKNDTTITNGVANVFIKAGIKGIGVQKVRSALRDMSINFFKHRKSKDPLYVNINCQNEARNSILMAIIDYKEIFQGNQNRFIHVCAIGLAKEFIKAIGIETPTEKIFYKDIALEQLKQAIRMFLAKQYVGAITLAGAADNILISLLETNGGKCFSKIIKEKNNDESTAGEIRKKINNMFGINAVKHMDSLEDRYIKFDLKENSWGAILKTLPNYKLLDKDLYNNSVEVRAFLRWMKNNLDPKIYHIDRI